jgi:hypothetical protein
VERLSLHKTAAALGISHVALLNAVRDGRVTEASYIVDEKNHRKFDVESARQELAANSNPSASARGRMNPGPGKGKGDKEPSARSDAAKLSVLKLREEVISKRLENKRKKGSLIDKQSCAVAWSGFMSDAKSKLLAMGDTLCASIANCSDPIECKEMIDAKVREALASLAGGDKFGWIKDE